jgi:acyl carrier protein
MTPEAVQDVVIGELRRVAPEIDPARLRLDGPLRDQVDLDSMDFLNVIVALHDRLGVEVPESDYAQLSSVRAIVAYLEPRIDATLTP